MTGSRFYQKRGGFNLERFTEKCFFGESKLGDGFEPSSRVVAREGMRWRTHTLGAVTVTAEAGFSHRSMSTRTTLFTSQRKRGPEEGMGGTA